MTKDALIQKTLTALSKLPMEKANEIADFADYLLKKYDEEVIQKGIQQLVSKSKPYEFLKDEETIYTVSDLKEVYKHEKR